MFGGRKSERNIFDEDEGRKRFPQFKKDVIEALDGAQDVLVFINDGKMTACMGFVSRGSIYHMRDAIREWNKKMKEEEELDI